MTLANELAKSVDFLDVEIEHKLFVEPVQNALANLDSIFESVTTSMPCAWEVYLTGSNNFRNKIATLQEYKGNRKLTAKPQHYEACRDRAIKKHRAVVINDMEADDELAIRSEELLAMGKTPVLVTIDKDLKQVGGWYYDWVKKELEFIEPLEAKRYFYIQMLMGDSSDNIPGLPDVGPKTAAKLLSKCRSEEEMWRVVKDSYNKLWTLGKVDEALQEIGTLLWMQRTRTVSLWSPCGS